METNHADEISTLITELYLSYIEQNFYESDVKTVLAKLFFSTCLWRFLNVGAEAQSAACNTSSIGKPCSTAADVELTPTQNKSIQKLLDYQLAWMDGYTTRKVVDTACGLQYGVHNVQDIVKHK